MMTSLADVAKVLWGLAALTLMLGAVCIARLRRVPSTISHAPDGDHLPRLADWYRAKLRRRFDQFATGATILLILGAVLYALNGASDSHPAGSSSTAAKVERPASPRDAIPVGPQTEVQATGTATLPSGLFYAIAAFGALMVLVARGWRGKVAGVLLTAAGTLAPHWVAVKEMRSTPESVTGPVRMRVPK